MNEDAKPQRFTEDEITFYREKILGAFPGQVVQKTDIEHDVQCPDPEGQHANGDASPSLGVDLRRNGSGVFAVLNCRSQGCSNEKVLREVGLSFADIYYSSGTKGAGKTILLPGCNLKDYARYKNLPVDFLRSEAVGLEDDSYYCKVRKDRVPAVRIPYADEDGNELVESERWRTGLYKVDGGDVRMRHRAKSRGGELTLYGRWRREEALEAGHALLVEGESDCHVAWYQGVPVFGVPGAQNWRDEWATYLEGIATIFGVVEPDRAGEEFWKKINACPGLRGRVKRTVLG